MQVKLLKLNYLTVDLVDQVTMLKNVVSWTKKKKFNLIMMKLKKMILILNHILMV